nr:DNA-binding protein [uncultured Prevotella sp.]
MIEFKVAPRKATMGKMKGKTVHIAVPKGQQKISPEMVLERIVRETSLTEGDARNVIITLRNLILDLGDIFSLRVNVPSKMEENEKDVCAKSLNAPKLTLTWKESVRKALKELQVDVDNPARKKKSLTPDPSPKEKENKEENGPVVG